MNRSEAKKGDFVYYHPIVSAEERFIGVLNSEPFQLGHGEWVAHLKPMDNDYEKKYGKAWVVAASLKALEICHDYSGADKGTGNEPA